MKIRNVRKVVSTLLAIAIMLTLGSCGVPVPSVSGSAEPPASSVPEVPPVPADPAPADPASADPAPAAQSAEKPAARPSKAAQELLTEAQAEAVALNHAGLTAAQVKGLRSQFDVDDGVKEWDVEFWHDGWEYDYEIHAVSGAIRSFDKERD